MLTLIRDLYAYQSWADAEICRLIAATPAAKTDPKVLQLLNHLHAVQQFFLLSVQGEPPSREEMMRELSFDELRASMQKFHRLADSNYLPKLRESRLRDKLEVPWLKEFQPTCHEVLVQAVMHSQHHRAQAFSLVRSLGGESIMIDYIVWVSKGRPEPVWEVAVSTAS